MTRLNRSEMSRHNGDDSFFNYKKHLKAFGFGAISFVVLAGLFFILNKYDLNIKPTETAYLYQKDIYKSERFNPGSDYRIHVPFTANYQTSIVDYSTTRTEFDINYTLTDKENKTRVVAKAVITYRLMRNPDDSTDLQFKDDEYAQFFISNIKPSRRSLSLIYDIEPSVAFNQLMNETLDRVFRGEFTNQDLYPDFNSIEGSIFEIRDNIKTRLVSEAKKVFIEIVGVSISSPVVPAPIENSRNKMLELQQEQLNTVKELEVKSSLAAGQMAVDVRDAINNVVIDRIVTGNTNSSYLFLKILDRAVETKAPMTLSVTPDFMRYLDKDSERNSTGGRASDRPDPNDYFDKFKDMTNEEMVEHFKR